jgi:hypothetical protein
MCLVESEVEWNGSILDFRDVMVSFYCLFEGIEHFHFVVWLDGWEEDRMKDLLGHHKCGSHMSVKSYTLSSSPASAGISCNRPIFGCAVFSCIHRNRLQSPRLLMHCASIDVALRPITSPRPTMVTVPPTLASGPAIAMHTCAHAHERCDVNAVRVERELIRLIF